MTLQKKIGLTGLGLFVASEIYINIVQRTGNASPTSHFIFPLAFNASILFIIIAIILAAVRGSQAKRAKKQNEIQQH